MSLGSIMLASEKQKKVEKIPIEFIKTSKFNRMPIIDIDKLAEQIKTNGLQNPIHLRQVEEQEFICIGGERRLTATRQCGFTEIEAIIREDIKTDHDEQLAVAINNVQREETKEVLQIKIFEWSDIYESEKKLGNIESGVRRADWIAQFTSCSRSTVQRYLKTYEDVNGNTISQKQNKLIKTPEIKHFENKLSEYCGTKAVLSNKSLTLKFNDLEDLNRILETIGFDLNSST